MGRVSDYLDAASEPVTAERIKQDLSMSHEDVYAELVALESCYRARLFATDDGVRLWESIPPVSSPNARFNSNHRRTNHE